MTTSSAARAPTRSTAAAASTLPATRIPTPAWSHLGLHVGVGGSAQGDTLTSIENVTESNFDDILIGDTGSNVLDGGAGNDTIPAVSVATF